METQEKTPDFFKARADELNLSADDVAYQLAQKNVQVTSAAVRNWFNAANAPSLDLAEPLAEIFKTSKRRILDAMHEIAVARKAGASRS